MRKIWKVSLSMASAHMFVWLSVSTPVQSEPLSVVGMNFPNVFRIDGTGYYDPLLKRLQNLGLIKKHSILPFITAVNKFKLNEVDCMVPTSIKGLNTVIPDTSTMITSLPFNIYYSRIITLPSKTPPKSLAEVKGKVVGTITGLNQEHLLKLAPHTSIQAVRYTSLFRMMLHGRTEMSLVTYPDFMLEKAFKEGRDFTFSPSFVPLSGNESFVCNNKSKDTLKKIDAYLQKWIENGEMKKMLKETYTLGLNFHS